MIMIMIIMITIIARAYLFPYLSKLITFVAAPSVLPPVVRNQLKHPSSYERDQNCRFKTINIHEYMLYYFIETYTVSTKTNLTNYDRCLTLTSYTDAQNCTV